VDFLLLGPMEAYHNGIPGRSRAPAQRAVPAGAAVLEAGRVLPVDRLAALLWDDEPPDHARATVQTHVSRLRTRLDPGRQGRYGVRVVSRGEGYLVEVDPDHVDVHRFRRLVDAARRLPAPADRAAGLRRALALWRGAPLADVASDRLRDRVCSGLMEERLSALETCLEAGLAAGAHDALLPELTDLVAEHPHRQRLAGTLMLALYRAGRQPGAVAAYHRVRARPADEFGLDPGPQLRRLHESILRDDVPADPSAPADPLVPRPAQLPVEPMYFTGRGEQIGQLDRMLEADVRAPTVVISALSGAAGVGKTALAVAGRCRPAAVVDPVNK
jgi:DNA-binding SARP family transcriptional activator